MKTKYTRKELIEICEQAIVPQKKWDDRDCDSAHRGIGKAWAYLKAGCEFEVRTTENRSDLTTDDHTIWIDIWSHHFMWFECGADEEDCGKGEEHRYYLPTPKRLKEADGGDWY